MNSGPTRPFVVVYGNTRFTFKLDGAVSIPGLSSSCRGGFTTSTFKLTRGGNLQTSQGQWLVQNYVPQVPVEYLPANTLPEATAELVETAQTSETVPKVQQSAPSFALIKTCPAGTQIDIDGDLLIDGRGIRLAGRLLHIPADESLC